LIPLYGTEGDRILSIIKMASSFHAKPIIQPRGTHRWPIRRSHRSYFEPTIEVGAWNDFRPERLQMEMKMRNMESRMEDSFKSFNTLLPASSPSLMLHDRPLSNLPQSSLSCNLAQPPLTLTHSSFAHPTHALMNQHTHDMMMSPSHDLMMNHSRDLMMNPSHDLMMNPSRDLMMNPSRDLMNDLKIDNTTDKDGNKTMSLKFDVRQFQPEDIHVETHDRQLCVHAKHEEKSDGKHSINTFQRVYMLPENIEGEKLSSVLSPEGVLTVEAPVRAIEGSKQAAIKHQ